MRDRYIIGYAAAVYKDRQLVIVPTSVRRLFYFQWKNLIVIELSEKTTEHLITVIRENADHRQQ